MDGRVLGPQLGQLVGEPFLARQHLECGGFARALRAFEDQHVVGLDPRPEDADDGRNQPQRTHGVMEGSGFGPEIGAGPGLDPGVPSQRK